MKRGEDVTQQFKRLYEKFKLIEEIDKMIKKQNELLKNQNNQQDSNDVKNQHSSLKAVSHNNHKDKRTLSPSTLKRLIWKFLLF